MIEKRFELVEPAMYVHRYRILPFSSDVRYLAQGQFLDIPHENSFAIWSRDIPDELHRLCAVDLIYPPFGVVEWRVEAALMQYFQGINRFPFAILVYDEIAHDLVKKGFPIVHNAILGDELPCARECFLKDVLGLLAVIQLENAKSEKRVSVLIVSLFELLLFALHEK